MYMCVPKCICIFALSICKLCIDLLEDISSNAPGEEECGEGQLSFSLQALMRTSIYEHFQAWGGVRSR